MTWQQYQRDLDEAFAEVCKYYQTTSIGFKVMYNQIPPQFIRNKKLQQYFKDNDINIIHLVREAKILVLASSHDVRVRGFHHTTNSSMIQETPPLDWDEKDIDKMLEMEKTSTEWQDKVHKMAPFVQNYYVAYENILRKEKRNMLVSQIVAFISGSFDPNVESAEGTLLKESESSCSTRIANYTEFRAHDKVINSRSAAACDLIEGEV